MNNEHQATRLKSANSTHGYELKLQSRQTVNSLFAKLFLACLFGFCLNGCTVGVPRDVIGPEKMEEILYDYHLAGAVCSDLKNTEKYKRELYEQYVFQKHDITKEELDSSLVWYTRHTKELSQIYDNVNKRLLKEKEHIEMYTRPDERTGISEPGDSVDVWNDFRFYRLTESPLLSKLSFTIPADSNFHPKDTFEWKLRADFLNFSSMKDSVSNGIMSFALLFENDSAMGISRKIDRSGTYSLTLHTDSAFKLKEIAGYVYLEQKKDSLGTPILLLSEIELMRYRHEEEKP